MGGHDFDRVEQHDDGHRLVCECGWRSRPDKSARAVGDAWDEHRMAVGAAR
ncbi:MAG: hypothetical protein JWN67_1639 [Actinomycetia bacterium]|nr:hypothetical protein [Actinomycetes bacterium]